MNDLVAKAAKIIVEHYPRMRASLPAEILQMIDDGQATTLDEFYEQVQEMVLSMQERGVPLPETVKRRDRREPKRTDKEKLEDNIDAALRRYWNSQARRVMDRVQELFPERKAYVPFDDIFFQAGDAYNQVTASLIRYILTGAIGGIELFAESVTIGIDWTGINRFALEFARNYAFDLIRGIDQVSRDRVSSAVDAFIETPGFTMRDLQDMLPFSEQRSRTIAVTETTRAYAQGQQMAADELAKQFPDVLVVKTWFTNNDDKVCPICAPLEGMEVPYNEMFDGSIDRPPAHVNCILPGNEVVIPDLVAAAKSFYVGRAVEITLANGRNIAVTENHPILTSRGWVAANLLTELDDVITATDAKRIALSINPDYDDMPTRIEEIFSSLKKSNGVCSAAVKSSAKDFYGDGRFLDGNIDVVYSNRLLLDNRKIEPAPAEELCEAVFDRGNTAEIALAGDSALLHLGHRSSPSNGSGVRVPDHVLPIFGTGVFPSDKHTFGDVARLNPGGNNSLSHSPAIDTSLARQFMLRFSGLVASEEIVKISYFDFSGHVYDLQSDMYELYTCNTVIVKNCRCWTAERTRVNG